MLRIAKAVPLLVAGTVLGNGLMSFVICFHVHRKATKRPRVPFNMDTATADTVESQRAEALLSKSKNTVTKQSAINKQIQRAVLNAQKPRGPKSKKSRTGSSTTAVDGAPDTAARPSRARRTVTYDEDER